MTTMTKKTLTTLGLTAAILTVTAADAFAGGGGTGSGNTFNNIAQNIIGSISDMPALLSGLSYMFGIMLGALGIMKIKDHVENPSQTHLKDGAVRLAAGGGLLALPIVFEAMKSTIGNNGQATGTPTLNAIDFTTN